MTKTFKFAQIATASLVAVSAVIAASAPAEAGQRNWHRGQGGQQMQASLGMHGMLAAPQPPSISCVGPEPMRCVITATYGIARVRFVNEGPAGRIDVFSRSYRGCPTEVTVSWNSDLPVNNSRIVQCMPKPVVGLF